MSSEKLASEELAHWRVQTMKRDLEKIKEREEEVGAMGGTIRKMTYKGEIEIEHTEEHLEVCVCVCVREVCVCVGLVGTVCIIDLCYCIVDN
jgi:hypothetical protein